MNCPGIKWNASNSGTSKKKRFVFSVISDMPVTTALFQISNAMLKGYLKYNYTTVISAQMFIVLIPNINFL
jgi:hypothetical protein